MGNFWKRKIKNTKQIADKVGVEEQKIKELVNGEREITGEAMDKVLNAINEEKNKTELEKKVEEENVINWIRNANLEKLIKDFGFGNQKDCAKKIGIAQSSLNIIKNKKFVKYSSNMQKVYDFFNNEFNKQAKKDTPIKEKINSIEEKDIVDFFKKENSTNLKNKLNLKNKDELADLAGCSRGSLENFFGGFYRVISPSMKKAYINFQEALNQIKTQDVLKQEETPQILMKDEININTPQDTKTIENEVKNDELDGVEKEKENEEPKKEEKKKLTRKELKQKIKKLKNRNLLYNTQIANLSVALIKANKENAKLKKQIERYEILIDRLR